MESLRCTGRTPDHYEEWEADDIRDDPTERHNVALERPGLVRELSAAWEQSAWDNKVFPLNDFTGYMGTVRRPFEDRLTEPVRILAGTPHTLSGTARRNS